jgi:hypothetical protein
MAKFMMKEWQRYYAKVRAVANEEAAVTPWFIEARAAEKIGPFLSYFDDHEHLQDAANYK